MIIKQWCKNHDVPFVLSPWHGRDNDGFEAVYTEAERSYLDEIAPAHRKSHTQLEFRSYRYLLKTETSRVSAAPGESIAVKGKIQNTGNTAHGRTTPRMVTRPSRLERCSIRLERQGSGCATSNILCPESEVLPQDECDIEIECPTEGLKRGVYTLKVGLIREDGLWFENKGNEPATVDIELGLHAFPEDATVSCELLDAAVPVSVRAGHDVCRQG